MLLQRLYQGASPRIRWQKSPDRVRRFSAPDETPRHNRTLHQRTTKVDMRAEPEAQGDYGEGGAASGRERREAEEGAQARPEYQSQRQRHLESAPRRWYGGIGYEWHPFLGYFNCTNKRVLRWSNRPIYCSWTASNMYQNLSRLLKHKTKVNAWCRICKPSSIGSFIGYLFGEGGGSAVLYILCLPAPFSIRVLSRVPG
jgi:hypothetical protein